METDKEKNKKNDQAFDFFTRIGATLFFLFLAALIIFGLKWFMAKFPLPK